MPRTPCIVYLGISDVQLFTFCSSVQLQGKQEIKKWNDREGKRMRDGNKRLRRENDERRIKKW